MAEPLPKKPKRSSLLPDLTSMEAQRSSDRQAIRAVQNAYEEIRQVNLECLSGKRLEKLDDDVKLFWLMAKYGVIPCMKAMVAMRAIPSSLKNQQAHKYVCRVVDAGP